uniref:Uncharacterized protein n=1 Tax=Percolomonas cosmopolitus TaxID=63605 RepID=A0A7S1KT81_9EUKA|mmetsp:Transcript_8670/g.32010  ORF Transcript_8670/g.32010 Transcript_8670/m.32010 type:complete len:118 (+) Transcript_8670:32-385(+)
MSSPIPSLPSFVSTSTAFTYLYKNILSGPVLRTHYQWDQSKRGFVANAAVRMTSLGAGQVVDATKGLGRSITWRGFFCDAGRRCFYVLGIEIFSLSVEDGMNGHVWWELLACGAVSA